MKKRLFSLILAVALLLSAVLTVFQRRITRS